MLKWFTGTSQARIARLETEVKDLKSEVQYLKNQNRAMIEYIENLSKYEKQLIDTIEQLTQEVTTNVRGN